MTLRNSHKSVETSVLTFIKVALHVDITPVNISTVHRLKAGTKDTSCPVIVRCTSRRRVRNEVYRAKMRLRDSTAEVFVSEHLAKSDADLRHTSYDARKLVKKRRSTPPGPKTD